MMKATVNHLKRTVTLILLLLAGAVMAAQQASGQKEGDKNDAASSLPEGAGRALMLQACMQCHDFKAVVSQRKTARAWRRTVNEMIWRGAPLVGDEAEVVTDYLAAAFGPDAPLPEARQKAAGSANKDAWAQYLPEGEGRALVIQSCVQCHDLKTTVAQRKTAAAWRRTVNAMVRLGTPLAGNEAEVITEYLAVSFGPGKPIPDALRGTVPGDNVKRMSQERKQKPR